LYHLLIARIGELEEFTVVAELKPVLVQSDASLPAAALSRFRADSIKRSSF
jgi:hypothetical protein